MQNNIVDEIEFALTEPEFVVRHVLRRKQFYVDKTTVTVAERMQMLLLLLLSKFRRCNTIE